MVRPQLDVRWLKGQTDVGDQLAPLFRRAAEDNNFGEGAQQSDQFVVGADEGGCRQYVSVDHASMSGDDEGVSVRRECQRGDLSTALGEIEGFLLDFAPVT